MAGSYIVAGARTPIGKMSGALASLQRRRTRRVRHQGRARARRRRARRGRARDHGPGADGRAGPGAGAPGGRQGRHPDERAGVNINKVCLSGLNTIYLADQMIAAGEADIVIAGGMESMTNAPYLAAGARGGFRYGNTELADAIIKDGLWCAFDACLMGLGTERYAAGGITREQQDDMAMKSNERAAQRHQGRPLRRRDRAGERSPSARATRSSSRPTRACAPARRWSRWPGCKPAFDKEGTITAANAIQISDGGCALVMMSERAVEARGVTPLGQVVGYGMVAGPDNAVAAAPAEPCDPRSAGAAGKIGGRRRPVRDQRGLRRRRHRLDGRARRSPTRSSTSTVAPSRSATRSG